MERSGQPLDAEDSVDENSVDAGEKRTAGEIFLKLFMQLVGSLYAAFFAPGNKVFTEDGSIAVDNNIGEGR